MFITDVSVTVDVASQSIIPCNTIFVKVFWPVLQPSTADHVAVYPTFYALLLPSLRTACHTTAGADKGYSSKAASWSSGGSRNSGWWDSGWRG